MLKRQRKQDQSIVDEFLSIVNAKVQAGEISMAELARQADVARPYLYRVLDGTHTPSLDVAQRIANAVKLELRICNLVA